MYKSENGGNSWKKLEYPPYKVSALAIDPLCENTVYAGDGATRWVYKSTDFGDIWEQWQ